MMEFAIPHEHREFARSMIAADLKADRELLGSDLDVEDRRQVEAVCVEGERRLQHLQTTGTLIGSPAWLQDILTFEVRERWDLEDWRDPARVAWFGRCVLLVRQILKVSHQPSWEAQPLDIQFMPDPGDIQFDNDETPILTYEDGRGWVLYYPDDPSSPTAGVDVYELAGALEDIDAVSTEARQWLSQRESE